MFEEYDHSNEYIHKLFRSLYVFSKIPVFLLNDDRSYSHQPDKKSLFQNQHLDRLFDDTLHVPTVLIINSLEIYASFPCVFRGMPYRIGIGPSFLSAPDKSNFNQLVVMLDQYPAETVTSKISRLGVTSLGSFSSYSRFIYGLMTGVFIEHNEIITKNITELPKEVVEKKFSNLLFQLREDNEVSIPYLIELNFLKYIRSGNVKAVENFLIMSDSFNRGSLSKDPLTHFKYQGVSVLTVLAREAIQSGVDAYSALSLSDSYVQLLDTSSSIDEIFSLILSASKEYAIRISTVLKHESYSQKIRTCIMYIRSNLHHQLSLTSIAEAQHLTPAYLSTCFKQETGITITHFIQMEKIEEAKRLLRYTTQSYSDISNYLGFANQSYFISVFKKNVSLTPKQYREQPRFLDT